jgi:hypothetical protein
MCLHLSFIEAYGDRGLVLATEALFPYRDMIELTITGFLKADVRIWI